MIDTDKIATEVANQILKEENDARRKVVVYSGRFQPMHPGHYGVYKHLVDKFGKNNVYIGTSGKVSPPRSPFSFKEKKHIMTKMFRIPSDKIVQIKNPYAPKEILKKFDGAETAFITVVSEKDRSRLGGSYFEEYKENKDLLSYRDKGYVYTAPMFSGGISASEIRSKLGEPSSSEEVKEMEFKRIYGKFDPKVFDLVTDKLTESVILEWLIERNGQLFEMPKGDVKKVDNYADKQLDPINVDLTKKHFFDRLNDPRNKKDISMAELIGFFKRLRRNKKEFIDFLNKYKEVVVSDNRSKINIPFVKQANNAIAKTIMRKPNFYTSDPKITIESELDEAPFKIKKGYDFIAKQSFGKVKKGIEYIVKDIKGRIGDLTILISPKNDKKVIPVKVRSMPEFYASVMGEGVLSEGGAASDGSPIPAECSADMYRDVAKIVSKELGISTKDMKPLGSVGKKPKGDYCGDIDIAVDGMKTGANNELSFDEVQDFIHKKVKRKFDNVVNNPGTGVVSFLYPIPGSDEKGQVDLMIVEDVDYANWYYSSPNFTKNESEYKGMYANLLLASIASNIDTKDVDKYFEDEFGGEFKGDVKSFSKFSLSPKQGLVKQFKSFVGKTTKLSRAKTISRKDQPITKAPDEIVDFLLGSSFNVNDTKSFESIWKAINSSQFAHKNKRNDIIKTFKEAVLRKNMPLPSELK